ncbi:MAG: hypothetical protein QOD69_2941 [Solirubrobacteraceae bacterium]|nr:hypothetical protein [Solirubrobacteraceae bacterium]
MSCASRSRAPASRSRCPATTTGPARRVCRWPCSLGGHAPVAQWIERSPPEREVAGSNPAGRAFGKWSICRAFISSFHLSCRPARRLCPQRAYSWHHWWRRCGACRRCGGTRRRWPSALRLTVPVADLDVAAQPDRPGTVARGAQLRLEGPVVRPRKPVDHALQQAPASSITTPGREPRRMRERPAASRNRHRACTTPTRSPAAPRPATDDAATSSASTDSRSATDHHPTRTAHARSCASPQPSTFLSGSGARSSQPCANAWSWSTRTAPLSARR